MKLIDTKSILLGMGLGIIITSILGVVFFIGYKPQLTDSEIINLAKKIGMVDRFEKGEGIARNPDGSVLFTIYAEESFTDVSKRLYEAGLIESSIEFELMLKKDNLQNSIKPGQYTVSFDDDLKHIIKKITGS